MLEISLKAQTSDFLYYRLLSDLIPGGEQPYIHLQHSGDTPGVRGPGETPDLIDARWQGLGCKTEKEHRMHMWFLTDK